MPAQTKEEGLRQVRLLVDRFQSRLDYYRSNAFEETSAREMFINPFFEALGWDVRDQRGLGPSRDVIVHLRIKGGGSLAGEDGWDEDLSAEELASRSQVSVSVPDYAFRIFGRLKFFVEAKKPSVNIRSKPSAFQVKSYAWSQQVPVAMLTDFEGLRVFDCTLRPFYEDPKKGLLNEFDLGFTDYVDKWDLLWATFSREAVEDGSLEGLVSGVRRRQRGSVRVDEAFLEELVVWRGRLAQDLADHNHNLDESELSEATQRILDRIVFLRVCEDRGVEPRIVLRRYARMADTYRRLAEEFRRLDVVYNGQLYSEHFSERLLVSDGLMQRLIESLYYPYSPYRFDVIGPDLLGSIYERFLGMEIVLDGSGKVSLVEKPEVRHSGGVYYTPKWVVDYIVAATLGPALKGKTPRAAKNIKIVDPACGSGSFLLGALEYFIRWHEAYYAGHPSESPDLHTPTPDGRRHLTSDAKAAILVNSIFGVDIDPQAVEVTQMSLYLKVLEEETSQSLTAQHRLLHTYLPSLSNNIKCGNSLLDRRDLPAEVLFDLDLARRVNPFEWRDKRHGFGDVFSERGGFDAVIGNPPYTRVQVLRRFRPEETEAYVQKFASASEGSFDIASLFVEQGLSILRVTKDGPGRLGLIITRQFAEADYGRPLRELLSRGRHVEEVVDFGSGLVFEGAGAYTLILILNAKRQNDYKLTRVLPPPSLLRLGEAQAKNSPFMAKMPVKNLSAEEWSFALPEEENLLRRLEAEFRILGDVVKGTIFQGVITGADYVFVLKDLGPAPDRSNYRLVQRRGSDEDAAFYIEEALLRPVYAGRGDLQPFFAGESATVLLLPYSRVGTGRYALITPKTLRDQYPQAFDWLALNEGALRERSGEWTDLNWYGFSRRQNLERFEEEKILIPYMVERLCAFLDVKRHFFVNVSTGGYGLPVENVEDAEFLAALLNSRLLSWVLKFKSRAWRGGWFAARKRNLFRLPIVGAVQRERAKVVQGYRSCLAFRRRVDEAKSDRDRALAARLYSSAVEEFDCMVEGLYGISESEARLIRSA